MKHIFILLIAILILSACNTGSSNDQNEEFPLGFTIPDSYEDVENPDFITVNGELIELSGDLLEVGDTISDVQLDMKADYFDQVESVSLSSFDGYKLIETVPSLDTPVCTMQTKQLEFAAGEFPNVDFIVISNDTPFALQRFCSENSIDNLTVLSDARLGNFGEENGFLMTEYNLLTRSIMIVNPDNEIEYIEYADEVTSELDLMNALAFLRGTTE